MMMMMVEKNREARRFLNKRFGSLSDFGCFFFGFLVRLDCASLILLLTHRRTG